MKFVKTTLITFAIVLLLLVLHGTLNFKFGKHHLWDGFSQGLDIQITVVDSTGTPIKGTKITSQTTSQGIRAIYKLFNKIDTVYTTTPYKSDLSFQYTDSLGQANATRKMTTASGEVSLTYYKTGFEKYWTRSTEVVLSKEGYLNDTLILEDIEALILDTITDEDQFYAYTLKGKHQVMLHRK